MKKSTINEKWEIYLRFTEIINRIKHPSKYIIGHSFLQPTRPTYNRIKTIEKIETISFLEKLILKTKYYYSLFSIIKKFIYLKFKKKNRTNLKEFSSNKFDVIIVSHLNNEQQFKKNEDLYFGNLMNTLSSRGMNILLVLIPHCSYRKESYIDYSKNNKNFKTYILSEKNNNFENTFDYILGVNKVRKELLKEAALKKGFEKNLYLYTAETIISRDNKRNFIFGDQISQIVQLTSAKNIITTYEGHSWERIFYFYSRIANKNIRCFGYLHTLLFEYDYSIFRVIKNKFDPNCIFTTGKRTKDILDFKIRKKIKVKTLGTPKFKDIAKDTFLSNKNYHLLFIPSGEIEEANIMTNFALKYAKFNPKIKIIIRYHPIIRNKFKFNNQLPNFKISNSDLYEDSQDSIFAIYSSSTSIFEAIQYGCLPIRLFSDQLISLNDPLWQINQSLIINIKNFKELDKLVLNVNEARNNRDSEYQKYIKLLNEIYLVIEKYNTKVLIKELSK